MNESENTTDAQRDQDSQPRLVRWVAIPLVTAAIPHMILAMFFCGFETTTLIHGIAAMIYSTVGFLICIFSAKRWR